MKKKIKIKFLNGLTFKFGVKEILSYVTDRYDFIDSEQPDFIIFGPYGIDIPGKSEHYTRIAYYCENFTPDMSLCEWAFGIPLEKEINHPRYKKIQWHNLDPSTLIKPQPVDTDQVIGSKTRFCNFLYSNKVPYREEFFKELSKYKKIDAPGKSMNNMSSIDSVYKGTIWERKVQYLQQYKFTIAFENYSYPGYQTEKLYDAMQVWSIPVYCGDPFITDIFNSQSFVNAFEILKPNYRAYVKALEKYVQMDFVNTLPQFYKSILQKVERKVKYMGRQLKMRLEYNGLDYKKLVDKIVEIDEDENLYKQMLQQPWFINNTVPEHTSAASRWIEIFG